MFENDSEFYYQGNTGGALIDEVIKPDTEATVVAIPYKIGSLFFAGPLPDDGFPPAVRILSDIGKSAVYVHEENTSGVLELHTKTLAQRHVINAQLALIDELSQPLWKQALNKIKRVFG